MLSDRNREVEEASGIASRFAILCVGLYAPCDTYLAPCEMIKMRQFL